jgi:catechol 2,3-dioxygenase-like lactoylglutathione lyase family enzyme
MKIEFLSTLAVIAPDPPASRKLYVDALGLPLESRGDNDYRASEQIGGCKHFTFWPRRPARRRAARVREDAHICQPPWSLLRADQPRR